MITLRVKAKTLLTEDKLKKLLPDLVSYIAHKIFDGIGASINSSREPLLGRPYEPLKRETLAARVRRNINGFQPLIASGEMLRSARLVVKNDSALITMDEKAIYHQFGTSRGIPARKFIPERDGEIVLPKTWEKDIDNFLERYFD